MLIGSWNVNSIRARIHHVKVWLSTQKPDVLLLQELRGSEFPAIEFKELGYYSAAVTQKAYNGVAILSRHPVEVISTTLIGDDTDSHARFLETRIDNLRIANIYLPNGNPVGSANFAYKLSWWTACASSLRSGSFPCLPITSRRIERSEIDKTLRSLDRPTDHAPIMLWLK
jgi:exodeoxyribonuclease III